MGGIGFRTEIDSDLAELGDEIDARRRLVAELAFEAILRFCGRAEVAAGGVDADGAEGGFGRENAASIIGEVELDLAGADADGYIGGVLGEEIEGGVTGVDAEFHAAGGLDFGVAVFYDEGEAAEKVANLDRAGAGFEEGAAMEAGNFERADDVFGADDDVRRGSDGPADFVLLPVCVGRMVDGRGDGGRAAAETRLEEGGHLAASQFGVGLSGAAADQLDFGVDSAGIGVGANDAVSQVVLEGEYGDGRIGIEREAFGAVIFSDAAGEERNEQAQCGVMMSSCSIHH